MNSSNKRTPSGWKNLSIVFLLLVLLTPLLRAQSSASGQVFQSKPIPRSIEELRSATDDIGIVPESRITDEILLPPQVLPALRDQIFRTEQPFIDDSIFSVQSRTFYRHADFGQGVKAEALATGGALSFESGWYEDFLRLGVVGYSSQKIYGPEDRDGTTLLRRGQESYTLLGQAYLELQTEFAHAILGRQAVDLPYINGDDWPMTQNTFEGVLLSSRGFDNLRFGFGHIERMRLHEENSFKHMSEQAGAEGSDKGVSGFGLRYEPGPMFYAAFYNHYGWDTFNTFYTETERSIPLGTDLTLRLGAQFTDQRSVGDELLDDFESQAVGVKATLGYGGLIATGAFTWVSKDHGPLNPWGGSASYNTIMLHYFDRAAEKAGRLSLAYDLSRLGLEGGAVATNLLYGNTPETGRSASPDMKEMDLVFDYRPPVKFLDNLWFRTLYGVLKIDDQPDIKDLRFILRPQFLRLNLGFESQF